MNIFDDTGGICPIWKHNKKGNKNSNTDSNLHIGVPTLQKADSFAGNLHKQPEPSFSVQLLLFQQEQG